MVMPPGMQRELDRHQLVARMHGRHRGAEAFSRLAHQRMEQIPRPAAGEDVMQARAPILRRLQRDQMIQQPRISKTPLHPDRPQFGLQAAARPLLVLEVFAKGLATLGVPVVIARFGHDHLHGLTRLAGFACADPPGHVQPLGIQQPRHLFQRDRLVRRGDDAMIVVHGRAQRLHRAAASLMREEADDLVISPEHGDRRAGADPRGDLGIVPAEIGAGQIGIASRPRTPQGDGGGIHRRRVHDLDLQHSGHTHPLGALRSKVHSTSHPALCAFHQGSPSW